MAPIGGCGPAAVCFYRADDGQVKQQIIGATQDITARKQAEGRSAPAQLDRAAQLSAPTEDQVD